MQRVAYSHFCYLYGRWSYAVCCEEYKVSGACPWLIPDTDIVIIVSAHGLAPTVDGSFVVTNADR